MQSRSTLQGVVVVLALAAILAIVAGCRGSKSEAPAVAGGAPEAQGAPAGGPPPAQAAPGGAVPKATPPPAPVKPIDARAPDPTKVVATVDGTPITQGKVYQLAAVNRERLAAMGQRLPEGAEKDLRNYSLTLLIDSELLLGAARRAGLKADPKDIDTRFQQLRSQFGSTEAFNKHLVETKFTEPMLREELANQILVGMYRDSVTANVKASEPDARKFYEQNKSKLMKSDEVRVQQILIRSASSDLPEKREAARKRAQEACAKAKGGEDFAKLAKEYSQTSNAAKGGDTGFFSRGEPQIFPKFQEVAFGTPKGQVSDVFETPYGFNVIKVVDLKPPTQMTFDEVKPQLMARMTQDLQGQALGAKLQELATTAKISILDPEFLPPRPEQKPASPPEGKTPAQQGP